MCLLSGLHVGRSFFPCPYGSRQSTRFVLFFFRLSFQSRRLCTTRTLASFECSRGQLFLFFSRPAVLCVLFLVAAWISILKIRRLASSCFVSLASFSFLLFLLGHLLRPTHSPDCFLLSVSLRSAWTDGFLPRQFRRVSRGFSIA